MNDKMPLMLPGDTTPHGDKRDDNPIGKDWFGHQLILYKGLRVAAELRITLNIYLHGGALPKDNRVQDADKPRKTFLAVPWGHDPKSKKFFDTQRYHEGTWDRFTALVQQQSTEFWNNKMWLQTPDGVTDLDYELLSGKTWRPNIRCLFECVAVREKNKAHARTTCWRLDLDSDGSPRLPPPVGLVLVPPDTQFRSDCYLFDSLDVVPRTHTMRNRVGSLKPGDELKQIAIAHEIGHLLGLAHSAVEREKDDEQYGDFAGAEEWMPRNIMGAGSEIHPATNATPWIDRIEKMRRAGMPGFDKNGDSRVEGVTSGVAKLVLGPKGGTTPPAPIFMPGKWVASDIGTIKPGKEL